MNLLNVIGAYLAAVFAALALADGPRADMAPIYVAQSLSPDDPFTALVGKRRERRADRATRAAVERYVLATDGRAFLFEDHQTEARVQFLCAPDDRRLDCSIDPEGPVPEIYTLTATRGPRGDGIYRNAAGKEVLRIASYGGATVYWLGEGEGLAASKSFGDDPALRLIYDEYDVALRRAQKATEVISAAAGETISFDVGASPGAEGANVAVLADAVARAASGVKRLADDPTAARALSGRVKRVAFAKAEAPGIALDGPVLTIQYVPGGDIDGRPTSAAIAEFLEQSL